MIKNEPRNAFRAEKNEDLQQLKDWGKEFLGETHLVGKEGREDFVMFGDVFHGGGGDEFSQQKKNAHLSKYSIHSGTTIPIPAFAPFGPPRDCMEKEGVGGSGCPL